MGHSSSAIICPSLFLLPFLSLLWDRIPCNTTMVCASQLPSCHLADYTTCLMPPAGLGQPTGQANAVQSVLPLTKHGDNLPGNQECERGFVFPNLIHRDPTVTAHELLWEKNKKTRNPQGSQHRGTEMPFSPCFCSVQEAPEGTEGMCS